MPAAASSVPPGKFRRRATGEPCGGAQVGPALPAAPAHHFSGGARGACAHRGPARGPARGAASGPVTLRWQSALRRPQRHCHRWVRRHLGFLSSKSGFQGHTSFLCGGRKVPLPPVSTLALRLPLAVRGPRVKRRQGYHAPSCQASPSPSACKRRFRSSKPTLSLLVGVSVAHDKVCDYAARKPLQDTLPAGGPWRGMPDKASAAC